MVCVSTALLLLNVAAPQVAQSAIAEALGASFTDLQWVLSGYALSLAVFLLTAGSLADRFGRRKLFLIGLAMFSLASGLCALAPSASTLIAARIVQGLGAAVVFPSSLAILAEAFQGAQRRRAIGAWGATIGLAFAAGPLIGGLLVDLFGWRAVFAASFVLGAPTLMLAMRHVERVARPGPAAGRLGRRRHAQPRAVRGRVRRAARQRARAGPAPRCSAAWRCASWRSPRSWSSSASPRARCSTWRCSATARSRAPRRSSRCWPAGRSAAFVYVTLFLLDVQERDPVEAGLVLAPLALVSFVVSAAAGRASERVPLRGALGRRDAHHRRRHARAAGGPERGRHVADAAAGARDHRPRGRAREPARRRSPTSACCRPRRAGSPPRSTTPRARSGSRSGSPCSARCSRRALSDGGGGRRRSPTASASCC